MLDSESCRAEPSFGWSCAEDVLQRDVALNDGLTSGLDQRRWRVPGMTALRKTVERIAARVLRILRVITVPRVWAREVAMAKVIEFYIPKNFRKSFKWVPEPQRGKILEFCGQTKKSA